jgi:hypothetical protein
MRAAGLAAGTVHHIHRTLRASLSEAVRRKHVSINAAMTAKAPRVEEEEIEPTDRRGGQTTAAGHVTPPQWHPLGGRARPRPATGGNAGPAMARVDLTTATVQVRHALQRRTWQHGCNDPHQCGERYHTMTPCKAGCRRHKRSCPLPCPPDCTAHARWCPQRLHGGLVLDDVKSPSGPPDYRAACPARCPAHRASSSPAARARPRRRLVGKNAGSCLPTPSGNHSIPEPTTENGQSY